MEMVKERKKVKNSFLSEMIRTVIPTAILTLLFLYLVGQFAIVCGRSMNDTLQDGDLVFMEKVTQRFGELSRFDIIIFDSNQGSDFIKRIIGLPGETVRIDANGNIYIYDRMLSENYGKEVMIYPGIAETGITLGDMEYFVLGDNRNNSEDSRFIEVGPISYYQIKGRVCYSLLPFSRIE